MSEKGKVQTPVYSLKKGDKFVADDQRVYVVDEIQKPDDWTALGEIGSKPKAWTILCHTGQTNRRFYYQGTKLVERR